jgi:outer membrane receptor for ferrienterochelin and colicin
MRCSGIFLLLLCAYATTAQTFKGQLNGTVKDKDTEQSLPAINIRLQGKDTIYFQSDLDGNFAGEAPVGTYSLLAEGLGYSPLTLYNINIGSGNAQVIQVEMEAKNEQLDEVVININRSARATDMTTPLSTQKLTSEEIRVNPGGNFDVSKVIQVLPGVAGGTSANRNDIIVRGGGPSENVYYLDGIEIPVLNHFQTQGASGGATGILNVSFINDVQLTSSAFDSRYDNALASTFVIKQRNGNPENLSGNLRLSGSEFAATLEGPLGKKTSFLASARRSYLQFLFQLLDLPIRPQYWDFQYKISHQFDKKTSLNLIGIGAIDKFKLVAPSDASPENQYILRANPLISQWNYTVGASLKRLVNNGSYTIALSRNMLYNGARRYENSVTASGAKLFELGSHEAENKLRIDVNKFVNGWKLSYGLGAQYVKYDLSLYNLIRLPQLDSAGNETAPALSVSQTSEIDFYKFGAYIHTSKYFLNDRLLVSGGLRSDVNTFTTEGLNPLRTISPRISAAYSIDAKWNISASVGNYYKLPSYTALGYRDTAGNLLNQDLRYINAMHYTVGTQFIPRNDFRFTVEAFYKRYNQYPVSLANGISLANIGTEYNAIGNEAYTGSGNGRVYGVEAYVQQKLVKKIFYVLSATFYKSEFAGLDGVYKPSTWDYGYVVAATLGYKFGSNCDLGLKYRIAGGQPYTPYDLSASAAQYLYTGRGVFDYTRLNEDRLPLFQQFDVRVDKKINFKRTSLVLFADFQNLLMYKTASVPNYTFTRNADNTDFATSDGNPVASDGSNAIPLILDNRSATIVPTIGFIFEF